MALSGRWLKASLVQPITVARLPGRLISESGAEATSGRAYTQTAAEIRTNGPIGAHRWPLELA
jgi:hypothetical protein